MLADRTAIHSLATLMLTAIMQLATAQEAGLVAGISSVDNDRLLIEFTLQNTSDSRLEVLRWNTPFEPEFGTDQFQVWYEGDSRARVRYEERHIKRGRPGVSDYLQLAPGESMSAQLDISLGYSTREAGNYSIHFDSTLEIYNLDAAIRLPEIIRLQSNEIVAHLATDLQPLWAKQPPTFSNCSASEQSQIDIALTEAERLTNIAVTDLNSTPESQRATSPRYTTWFGSYQSARYNTIVTNFNAIQDALSNKTVNFVCETQRCGESTFAFVYSNSPYDVYLCPGFWRAELLGTDSRAGTVVHEVSHFAIVANTDDHVYGQTGAAQLATSTPNTAIANADSHEFFVENTPPLAMAGTTTAPPPTTSQQLSLGAPVQGSLQANEWQYFEVTGANSVSLFNLSADLSLYIGNGAPPTASSYLCRPFRSGTSDESCSVNTSGTTYIGVTGFSAGSFSLAASFAVAESTPPAGQGQASAAALSLGIPVNGNVATDEWVYYRINGPAEISLYNLSSDLDLYVSSSANPTSDIYECRPYSAGTVAESCTISSEHGGFIGVNGFSGGSFSLVARAIPGPGEAPAFQTLTAGVAVEGNVADGAWSYFQVEAATEITLFNLTSDLDLYIGDGANPSSSSFLCRPFLEGNVSETCPANATGTTFIGVYGFTAGSFSLVANNNPDAGTPGQSAGAGNAQTISLGSAVTGTLALNEWTYFQVEGASEVTLFDMSADLDLYVSSTGNPGLQSYDCRPWLQGTVLETCRVTSRDTTYIGVYGYEAGSFSLVANGVSSANSAASIRMELNSTAYSAGESFLMAMLVNGGEIYDSYAAILLPTGDFFTYSPLTGLSAANTIVPFHSGLQVDGEQNHSVLSITLPAGLAAGDYQACGVLVRAGQSVGDESNWVSVQCSNFMVSAASGKRSARSHQFAKDVRKPGVRKAD